MTQEREHRLDAEEQGLLLRIARDSLGLWPASGTLPDLDRYPLTPRLQRKDGAFVTLHRDGMLRGCIGYTHSSKALARTVAENAVNAGFRDSRFEPVSVKELDALDIEISVLLPGGETEGSPFVRVHDANEILIGRDGLYLEHVEGHSGLLLPQVPVEQGWDSDQYLRGICMKSGLPCDAWKARDARLFRFQAQVFGEKTK